MPSYVDSRLSSYYASDFPADVSLWKLVREMSRISRQMPTVYKMRVAEWAVRALFNLNDDSVYAKAAEIVQAEHVLPTEQQKFGNLLAVLKSKVGTGDKDHEQIEEMFKFIIGTLPAKNTTLFNTLLNIAVDYATDYQIELRPEVINYDSQHRVIPKVLYLQLRLRPAQTEEVDENADADLAAALALSLVIEPPAKKFTPLADATMAPTTTSELKDDEEIQLEKKKGPSLTNNGAS